MLVVVVLGGISLKIDFIGWFAVVCVEGVELFIEVIDLFVRLFLDGRE
jgi:hypothetical protein